MQLKTPKPKRVTLTAVEEKAISTAVNSALKGQRVQAIEDQAKVFKIHKDRVRAIAQAAELLARPIPVSPPPPLIRWENLDDEPLGGSRG